jgi:hypothetical protein
VAEEFCVEERRGGVLFVFGDPAGDDAAADIDAAFRAQGEREVARRRAEPAAEERDRFLRRFRRAHARPVGNVDAGGARLAGRAVERAYRHVERDEAGAGEHALDGDAAEFLHQLIDDGDFARVGGGEIDVAAFARQGDVTSVP